MYGAFSARPINWLVLVQLLPVSKVYCHTSYQTMPGPMTNVLVVHLSQAIVGVTAGGGL